MNVIYSEDFSKQNIENYYREIIQMVFRDISKAQSESVIEFKPRLAELRLFANTEALNENNHPFIGKIILEKNIPDLITIGTSNNINNSPLTTIKRINPKSDEKGKAWVHVNIKNDQTHVYQFQDNNKLESKPIFYTTDSENFDSIMEVSLQTESDFIDLYFDYPPIKLTRMARYFYERQISLYVKRGDTVKFYYDMDSTPSLRFEGSNSVENNLLNSIPTMESYSSETFLKLLEETNSMLRENSGFSDDFYRKLSFKIEYLKHYFNLNKHSYNIDYKLVLKLSQLTNNNRYTNFKEYRDFLHSYCNYKLASALEPWTSPNKYDVLQLFFDGWDESYLQASRIVKNLRDPSNYSFEGSRTDYKRYLEDYPNSPFIKEIRDEFITASKFRVNSKLPRPFRKEIRNLGKEQEIQDNIIITIADETFRYNFLVGQPSKNITFLIFGDQNWLSSKYSKLSRYDTLMHTYIRVNEKPNL